MPYLAHTLALYQHLRRYLRCETYLNKSRVFMSLLTFCRACISLITEWYYLRCYLRGCCNISAATSLTNCKSVHVTLFPTAGEQCWFYHSSGNWGNSSPGRHFYCLLYFLCSSKVSSLAHTSCDLTTSSDAPTEPKVGIFNDPPWYTVLHCPDRMRPYCVDGTQQQVAISISWGNETTSLGFSELTHHQSHSVADILSVSLETLNFSPFYWALTEVNNLCKA